MFVQQSFRRFIQNQSFRSFSNEFITVQKLESRLYILTLSRKNGLNSFSKKMLAEFNEKVHKLSQDRENVSVVIVQSSVEKVFCAGADLKERLVMPESEIAAFVTSLRVFKQII